MGSKKRRYEHSEAQLEKMYKRYRERVRPGKTPLDFGDFIAEVKKRKGSHDVVKDIADKTNYVYTMKQAKARKRAIHKYLEMNKEAGENIVEPTLREIREGKTVTEWEEAMISGYYDRINTGMSTDEAFKQIKEEFWYSS